LSENWKSKLETGLTDIAETIPKGTHEGFISFGFGFVFCAVLDNGLRILSQPAFLELIGRDINVPSRKKEVFDKLSLFLAAKNL